MHFSLFLVTQSPDTSNLQVQWLGLLPKRSCCHYPSHFDVLAAGSPIKRKWCVCTLVTGLVPLNTCEQLDSRSGMHSQPGTHYCRPMRAARDLAGRGTPYDLLEHVLTVKQITAAGQRSADDSPTIPWPSIPIPSCLIWQEKRVRDQYYAKALP